MARGFDSTSSCAALAGDIKAAGYDFVARYLGRSAWKVISSDEAQQLLAAGLAIVPVYEDGPTSASYFSNDRGQADGSRAAQQLASIGAPPETTAYFAVDYDASGDDIAGPISQYFQGVVNALRGSAAANNPQYRAGVYGSGATCAALATAGLAPQGWLAQSTGWSGYASYVNWSVRQGMPSTVLGLSVDPDDAIGDYGAIIPPNP